MLDGKKYLELLSDAKLLVETCSHCGLDTHFISGGDIFCNFCEQRSDLAEQNREDEAVRASIAPVLSQLNGGTLETALKNADLLLKKNMDPKQLYLLGVFYRYVSGLMYYQKDYNLEGFMEPNSTNTEISLQLTAKWKECFFKVISIIDSEIEKNLQVETDLVLIKFISEARLRRFVDAANSLRRLQNLDRHGITADYALLIYSAEKNTKQTEASVSKAIQRDNINAYYYLGKFLSQQRKLEDAVALLQKLSEVSNVLMTQELLVRIRSAQEASRM